MDNAVNLGQNSEVLFVQENSTDPYFNLALEEYLFSMSGDEIFRLWINSPSVILGKHQIALAEVDYWYCRENNIPVIRRISGGGTVFHDPGNINFTLIQSGEQGKLVDFKKYMQPIADILARLGIATTFSGRNDILLHGYKISGNAEHTRKNRVIHHGTILYDSALPALGKAITRRQGIVQGKAVQSVRSKVANVRNYHDLGLISDFLKSLTEKAADVFPDLKVYHLNTEDRVAVNQLAEEKYKTWKWNFGYSPAYSFRNETHEMKVHLEVARGGVIKDAIISGDVASIDGVSPILIGREHREEDLENALERLALPSEINRQLLQLMF